MPAFPTEAAQKAAVWAQRADDLDEQATKAGSNLPNLEHPRAHPYQRDEAAKTRALIATIKADRDQAIRMAEMWSRVATVLSSGIPPTPAAEGPK